MSRTGFVALAIAFLVTRLAVLALYAPEPGAGDQTQYIRVAQSILDRGFANYLKPDFVLERGNRYPYAQRLKSLPDGKFNPIFWDPLYPLFLSGIYAASDFSHEAVRWVQLAVSLLTLLLGMDTVRRMFPGQPRAAEIFGWMVVAHCPAPATSPSCSRRRWTPCCSPACSG
jgi:hypothetical protein